MGAAMKVLDAIAYVICVALFVGVPFGALIVAFWFVMRWVGNGGFMQ